MDNRTIQDIIETYRVTPYELSQICTSYDVNIDTNKLDTTLSSEIEDVIRNHFEKNTINASESRENIGYSVFGKILKSEDKFNQDNENSESTTNNPNNKDNYNDDTNTVSSLFKRIIGNNETEQEEEEQEEEHNNNILSLSNFGRSKKEKSALEEEVIQKDENYSEDNKNNSDFSINNDKDELEIEDNEETEQEDKEKIKPTFNKETNDEDELYTPSEEDLLEEEKFVFTPPPSSIKKENIAKSKGKEEEREENKKRSNINFSKNDLTAIKGLYRKRRNNPQTIKEELYYKLDKIDDINVTENPSQDTNERNHPNNDDDDYDEDEDNKALKVKETIDIYKLEDTNKITLKGISYYIEKRIELITKDESNKEEDISSEEETEQKGEETDQATEFKKTQDTQDADSHSDNINQTSNDNENPTQETTTEEKSSESTKNTEVTSKNRSRQKEVLYYQIAIKDHDKQKYTLKLHTNISNSEITQRSKFLRLFQEKSHNMIWYVIDSGKFPHNDEVYYEICTESSGGLYSVSKSMDQNTRSMFLKQKLIPKMVSFMEYIHNINVSPLNLRLEDILCIKDNKNNDTIVLSSFYRFITNKILKYRAFKEDYYKLGLIISKVLYTEQSINNSELMDIERKNLDIDYNPEYDYINDLIKGLTFSQEDKRWEINDLKNWLKNVHNSTDYEVLDNINKSYLDGISTNRPENSINIEVDHTISTKDELYKYIEQDTNWHSKLIGNAIIHGEFQNWLTQKYDESTTNEIINLIKYTVTQIDDNPVGKLDRERLNINYSQETFFRYFNPSKKIKIGEQSFLITVSNADFKISECINKLDELSRVMHLEEIQFILYQLELTLKRLSLNSSDNNDDKKENNKSYQALKKLLLGLEIKDPKLDDNIFESELIKTLKPQADNININSTNHSYHKIINLFYHYDPDRLFYLNNSYKVCKSLEDLGLFITQNKNIFYTMPFQAEKDCYLSNNDRPNWCKLDITRLIHKIFKSHTKHTIICESIEEGIDDTYNINYRHIKSLSDFFADKKILITNIEETPEDIKTVQTKIPLIFSLKTYIDNFIQNISIKNQIVSLSEENKKEISDKISKEIKQLFWKKNKNIIIGISAGLFLLIAGSVTLFVISKPHKKQRKSRIAQIKTKNDYTNFDNPLDDLDERPKTKHVIKKEFELIYKFSKTQTPLTLYRSSDENAENIIEIPQGKQIYVLEKKANSDWYRVRYKKLSGFINSEYLEYN